jgi:predicted metal-dependent HD superfamily phosphohydrolase
LLWFENSFPGLAASLREAYGESHRSYHGWSHIEALLSDFVRLQSHFRAPDAVEVAIWYHDAVYQPFSKTNEKDSAALMRAEMTDRADASVLDLSEMLILATQTHTVQTDLTIEAAADCALFLDMDMAILGADPDVFDVYDAGVRQEYATVPDVQFREGRRSILGDFLSRDRIYITETFHKSHDARARSNLKRAIAALS